MNFGKSQQLKFGSTRGTYSVVTAREHQDSQITVAGVEAELLSGFFGRGAIFEGNVKAGGDKAAKTFRLHPDGQAISLNLVFPKPGKSELRLYLAATAGFKPDADDVWFMYVKNNELWIGAMDEAGWRTEARRQLIDDEYDADYQSVVQDEGVIKTTSVRAGDVYRRDRRIAVKRMELAGYQCEFDNRHKLFIAAASNKPFLEAHHLIPMSVQKDFSVPLDTTHNVYCLCPYCHRAIHHAEKPLVRRIIETLVKSRPEVTDMLSGGVDELHNFYSVEDIY